MPGFLSNLMNLPRRLARIENRLEEAIAYFAARSHPLHFTHSVYLGDHTALALLDGRLLIFVDTRGNDIAPHLLMHGTWETDDLHAFLRMVRPGDTVCDLGAHLGVYALAAAAAVGPAGRVHAFEPNPRHAGLMMRSIAVNGFTERTQVHLAAVGEADGVATLLFETEWSGGGFLDAAHAGAAPRGDGRRAMTARLVALDSFFADPAVTLDVAKLDIEGMEGPALRGMKGLLERSPDARLMLEWAPQMMAGQGVPAADVAAMLAGMGFRFWTIGGGGALAPLHAEALARMQDGIRNIIASRVNPH